MGIIKKSTEQVQTTLGKASAWIKDESGIVFKFDRVAHSVNGSVNLDQMRSDECLLAPGLIYRFDEGLNQ